MSKKPDFNKISLFDHKQASKEEWKKIVQEELHESIDNLLFETYEQIHVKPLYTEEDVNTLEHLDGKPGLPPYTRGPYPTMYVNRPWTVRQYAGFSTAEESNAFYRRNRFFSSYYASSTRSWYCFSWKNGRKRLSNFCNIW